MRKRRGCRAAHADSTNLYVSDRALEHFKPRSVHRRIEAFSEDVLKHGEERRAKVEVVVVVQRIRGVALDEKAEVTGQAFWRFQLLNRHAERRHQLLLATPGIWREVVPERTIVGEEFAEKSFGGSAAALLDRQKRTLDETDVSGGDRL